jgi:hypothetical protein
MSISAAEQIICKSYLQASGAPPRQICRKGQHPMTDDHMYSGMAALTICEALLLALNDAHILPEKEIMGILKDAAATHENACSSEAEAEADAEKHRATAALIRRIVAGGNSVRRP